MKILLTGAAGFIGYFTTKKLIELGHEVIGVDNLNDYYEVELKENRLKNLQNLPNFKFHKIDISDYKSLENIFKQEKFDAVCNLAAQAGVRYSLKNPFTYIKSNVDGFLNLLELCKNYNVPKVVYSSSSSVYGGNDKIPFEETDRVDNPVSLYAATKRSNELIAYTYHHLYDIKMIGLRFFTVYGPFGRPDMAYFKFAKKIANNEPIEIYNYGKMKRDFTYIDDIVDGVAKCFEVDLDFEIINLGNNKPEGLGKFIEILEKKMDKKAEKIMTEMQPGDVERTFAEIDKAKKFLGYNPKTDIKDGLEKFVDWFKDYYNYK